MSTPDHHTTPATDHSGPDDTAAEVEVRRARDAALYARVAHPTRTTTVISWLGWHAGELTGIGLPAALAATTWPGFSVLSVLTALAWAGHEARQRLRARSDTARPGPGESDVEGEGR
ncbi:hypothetical protein SAMN05421835_108184 [Amycolatopsis sacchari]|uniref:Uncharacterized protein n=1 Tax=Amycolatopsis sacchari TaxID=115433 RepID=A0A1I3U274_9PSEU|nr:hypothetical protein [Amycolatopsis sacchari]SFJ76629.1 hypothetical protein SAMN05421835_108184 [Amycolatopsis sacchari]